MALGEHSRTQQCSPSNNERRKPGLLYSPLLIVYVPDTTGCHRENQHGRAEAESPLSASASVLPYPLVRDLSLLTHLLGIDRRHQVC